MRAPSRALCAWSALAWLAAVGCEPPADSTSRSVSAPRLDCYGCHAADYRSVRHPPHERVRPTTCAVCHLERAWKPEQRNHPWQLTGAHATTDCFACHVGTPPLFANTPTACVGCHRADYDRSEYPGHDRFALTCADCHSTKAWRPAQKPTHAAAGSGAVETRKTNRGAKPVAVQVAAAPPRPAPSAPPTVEPAAPPAEREPVSEPAPAPTRPREHPESAFPIASGPHSDIACETCHDQPGRTGKANSDCVQCHKRSRFDAKHEGVSGYPGADAPLNFCVECHTRGRVRPIANSR
jgi:hypothetical protein